MNAVKVDKDFADFDKIENLAKEAFPPSEYVPPKAFLKATEMQEVDFWAFFDENLFVGYVVIRHKMNFAYLFFLAVQKELRNKGYGTQILKLLENLYPDAIQIVDFEMIDSECQNNDMRIRRKNFYLRNGYKEINLFYYFNNENFEIMSKKTPFDYDGFHEMMSSFIGMGFHPKFFSK
ncbi:MAG: GNAT family N-acetyltransferase [Coprobacillus sp.]|nr:GNAT family N-acetyltransferase [Coprobacillus sp.]